jgi:hypothetical protein
MDNFMCDTIFGKPTVDMIIDLLMQTFQSSSEPRPSDVESRVEAYLQGPFLDLKSEKKRIVDEILQRINVRIGLASVLEDDKEDHEEWLDGVDRSSWRLWLRLKRFLQSVEHLPPAVLNELDRSTDQTLGLLESPDRLNVWDRRGLVVGHVQSGKTTHYTSLITKAMDAGYQIVIVLAGIHNSLRSQTHERIDKHIIGKNSAALLEVVQNPDMPHPGPIGVGLLDQQKGEPDIPFTLITCTSSADDGDFNTRMANQVGFSVSRGSRLVMVVKKNATILRNLIRWLRIQNANSADRINAPAIIIDDEADHASVNTRHDPDEDPTTINRRIRELLNMFERVGFVGYTATPFANIFIPSEEDHARYGRDLFPTSFIVNLKAPADYIGPNLVFGHPGDESIGLAAQDALPFYIRVLDAQTWIPDKHSKDHNPGEMPCSLKEAIRLFVLICTARACRGDMNVHNSMLIHVTRFVNVQERVTNQVRDELDMLKNLLGSGSSSVVKGIKEEFKKIWDTHIVSKHNQFQDRLGTRCTSLPSWEIVYSNLLDALMKIGVMKINGESSDVLRYSQAKKGLSVIAIGGDRLSRGLTLEGLSVSYFLRSSKMFDTLMQMGRWFGYRPRYADLCRVYTTSSLYEAFREISMATDELRRDLDLMAETHRSPIDFGLRIRTPSDELLITAANKLRTGDEIKVRFAGEIVQALDMYRIGIQADQCRTAVERLIKVLGAGDRNIRGKQTSHFLWRNIPVQTILEFLQEYEAISTPCFNRNCEPLRRYIQEQVNNGELVNWTVAVISKQKKDGITIDLGDNEIVPIYRKLKEGLPREQLGVQGLTGSADEDVDLSKEQLMKVEAEKYSQDPKLRSLSRRENVRKIRDPKNGLLLAYFIEDKETDNSVGYVPGIAVSFPHSEKAKPLAYTVNDIWLAQFGLVGENDGTETQ